jgi:hypothetical protein
MSYMGNHYRTKAGTRVTHVLARAAAMIYEYRGAAEYKVYRDFRVGDRDAPRFDAVEGDTLLVYDSPIEGMAHALNLVNGDRNLIPWNDMAHTCKPLDYHLTPWQRAADNLPC